MHEHQYQYKYTDNAHSNAMELNTNRISINTLNKKIVAERKKYNI